MLVPDAAADEYFDFKETRSGFGNSISAYYYTQSLNLSLSVTASSCGCDFVFSMFDITR